MNCTYVAKTKALTKTLSWSVNHTDTLCPVEPPSKKLSEDQSAHVRVRDWVALQPCGRFTAKGNPARKAIRPNGRRGNRCNVKLRRKQKNVAASAHTAAH